MKLNNRPETQVNLSAIKAGADMASINWRDPGQAKLALMPADSRPYDQTLFCYRPNDELYAVLSPTKWRRLREQGKLNSFLDRQRR